VYDPNRIALAKKFHQEADMKNIAKTVCSLLTLLAVSGLADLARATPITITNPFNFRDEFSPNDVNITPGHRMTFGANSVVPNGAAGTTGTATQGGSTFNLNFIPFAISPNEFVRTINYNVNLTGAWNLTFTNNVNTSNQSVVATPSIGNTTPAIPFVVNMTLSGSGTTPTFSWTPPTPPADAPAQFDQVSIFIWDNENRVGTGGIGGNGVANIIHRAVLAASQTSYQLPSLLSSNMTLQNGHQYSVSIQLDKLRNPGGGQGGANVLSRSRSFFDFTPLSGVTPPVILPTDTSGNSYHFNIQVIAGQTYFIDPLVAIGYDYVIGLGNPNFASVVLPSIGDGLFDLSSCDGSSLGTVQAGNIFNFAPGGLDCFRVRGIEVSAGLDPNNTTAFITGLTFTGTGAFTGTMTPVTVNVANVREPATLFLVGFGLIGVAGWRRRRARTRKS
jgi:hypothetical protein